MAYFGPSSRLGEIVANPEACALMDKLMPGMSDMIKESEFVASFSLYRASAMMPDEIGSFIISQFEQIKV